MISQYEKKYVYNYMYKNFEPEIVETVPISHLSQDTLCTLCNTNSKQKAR